ncbi:MAG: SPFH/Band 7/PHB domain protein [Micrococcales bacterium]|nr:SPFH/Band 7/PHB domain protein [Micrococcales bacterium]
MDGPFYTILLLIAGLVVLFVIVALVRSVRQVSQGTTQIIERLGRYRRTLEPGLHLLVPFIDRVRATVDMREQVVPFPPQSVITSDNLVVSIDTVIYFQVTQPAAAVYEIANYIQAIEQLTVTTLRNIIGTMDLEQTLTSRDQINGRLSGVLDEATGRWGIKVNRVELKAIDPPPSVQGSMEQQMRAERDRRAAILTAEGTKQSAILTAEGEKQAAILRAEGTAQAAILTAEGEAKAILQVFDAVHRGDADPKLLAYQYLQMMPKIASSPSNKMWFLPSELSGALGVVAKAFGGETVPAQVESRPAGSSPLKAEELGSTLTDPREAVAEARRESAAATADATTAGVQSGVPFDPAVEAGQRPGGPGVAPPAPAAPPAPEAPPAAPQMHAPGQMPGQMPPQMPPGMPGMPGTQYPPAPPR